MCKQRIITQLAGIVRVTVYFTIFKRRIPSFNIFLRVMNAQNFAYWRKSCIFVTANPPPCLLRGDAEPPPAILPETYTLRRPVIYRTAPETHTFRPLKHIPFAHRWYTSCTARGASIARQAKKRSLACWISTSDVHWKHTEEDATMLDRRRVHNKTAPRTDAVSKHSYVLWIRFLSKRAG